MNVKKNCELKKGDVIRCEFGDYGNIVTVEVESIKVAEKYKDYTKIVGHYVGNKKHVEMYGLNDDVCEVLNSQQEANTNYCVVCGEEIPEGTLVCPECEKIGKGDDI